MISDEYAAGFFDGEGSVYAAVRGPKNNRSPTILATVANIQMAPLLAFKERWGGSINTRKLTRPNERPCSQWVIAAKQAKPFLLAVRPHLLIKGAVVDVAIDYCTLMETPAHERMDYSHTRPANGFTKSGRQKMTRAGVLRPEFRAKVIALHSEIRRLNQKAVPRNGRRAYANYDGPTPHAESDAA